MCIVTWWGGLDIPNCETSNVMEYESRKSSEEYQKQEKHDLNKWISK